MRTISSSQNKPLIKSLLSGNMHILLPFLWTKYPCLVSFVLKPQPLIWLYVSSWNKRHPSRKETCCNGPLLTNTHLSWKDKRVRTTSKLNTHIRCSTIVWTVPLCCLEVSHVEKHRSMVPDFKTQSNKLEHTEVHPRSSTKLESIL